MGHVINHQKYFNQVIILFGGFMFIQVGLLNTTTFYVSQLMDKWMLFLLSYSAISGTLAIFLLGFMVYLLGIQQRFAAINKCIE